MDARMAVSRELQRIEEDCNHSAKSHYNAADRWASYNFRLGLPSTVLSAIAGAAFLSSYPEIAGSLATVAAVLTGLMTFLKPTERATTHKASGDQYLALKNDARVFREIKLCLLQSDDAVIKSVDELCKRRNALNQSSPQFSQADRKLARAGIEMGESDHQVDVR